MLANKLVFGMSFNAAKVLFVDVILRQQSIGSRLVLPLVVDLEDVGVPKQKESVRVGFEFFF